MTDLASLKYRNEEALLGDCTDPEKEYLNRVLPDKIAMAKIYVRRASFLFDLALIVKTIFKVFDLRVSSLARSVK
jgi:lipopolysaccharide/colanic/teichoic acid biosynthesis glycosyltransferase